jgi:CheY-like chemotaxis protein
LVQTILVASDAPTLRHEVEAVISGPDVEVRAVTSGPEVVAFVAEESPDLVIVDMQMGNMGGMAVTLELRLEESYDAVEHIPVLMLLDRRPDVFLARRSGAEGRACAARRRDLRRRLLHARARAGEQRTPARRGTRPHQLTPSRRVATPGRA